jgi:hypothetical protein
MSRVDWKDQSRSLARQEVALRAPGFLGAVARGQAFDPVATIRKDCAL